MGRASDLYPGVPRLGLNRAEVAAAIGVSVNTVDEMVREGILPSPRRWHSRKFWITSEIAAYMAEWPVDGETGGVRAPTADDGWHAVA